MRRPAFVTAISLPFVVAIIPAASIFVSSPAPAGEEVFALDSSVPAGTTVHLVSMSVDSAPAVEPVAYGIGATAPGPCDGTSVPAIEG